MAPPKISIQDFSADTPGYWNHAFRADQAAAKDAVADYHATAGQMRFGFAKTVSTVMGFSLCYDGAYNLLWGSHVKNEQTGETERSASATLKNGVKLAVGALALYAGIARNPFGLGKSKYQTFAEKIDAAFNDPANQSRHPAR